MIFTLCSYLTQKLSNLKSGKMLNVLFASNDKFSPYLGVSIYSLLKNNCSEFEKINIYVLDDDISKENKAKIKEVVKSFNQEIQFIKTVNIKSILKNIDSMEKEGVNSLTTYSRLFASSLLPNIDKILYLDADSLITGSFKELWDLNIENYFIAAVEDLFSIDTIKKDIGLKNSNKYINAGFLFINLKKWREENLEKKFLEFQKEHLNKFIYHDQGIINGVCKDNILYIHPKYNLISIFHGIEYEKAIKLGGIPNYYDKLTVEDAQKNPVFIHFSGGDLNRPWSNKEQPYHELYYTYVNKTPFKDDINIKNIPLGKKLFYKFYKSRVLSFILKLMPNGLTVKIANKRVALVVKKENKNY